MKKQKFLNGSLFILCFIIFATSAGMLFNAFRLFGIGNIDAVNYYDSTAFRKQANKETTDLLKHISYLSTFPKHYENMENEAVFNITDYHKMQRHIYTYDELITTEITGIYMDSNAEQFPFVSVVDLEKITIDNLKGILPEGEKSQLQIYELAIKEEHESDYSSEVKRNIFEVRPLDTTVKSQDRYISFSYDSFVSLIMNNGVQNYDYDTETYKVSETYPKDAYVLRLNGGTVWYDPKKVLFYSTWDDYFTLDYEASIYKLRDIQTNMLKYDLSSNELIMALLFSERYTFSQLQTLYCDNYYDYLQVKSKIDNITQNSSIYYYVRGENGEFNYDNGKAPTSLQLMPYYVRINSEEIFGENSEVYFGIDVKNLKPDSVFYEQAQVYNKIAPIYYWLFVTFSLSLIFVLITGIRMFMMTGRRAKEDANIYCNGYDQLPFELHIMILALIYLSVYFSSTIILQRRYVSLMSNYLPNEYWKTMLLGIVTLGFISIVFCFLSFARQMKAHILWNNSLILKTYYIIKGIIISIYGRIKLIQKVLIVFLAYALLSFGIVIGCATLLFNSIKMQYIVYIPLWLILQILVIIFLIRYIHEIERIQTGTKEISNGNLEYQIEVKPTVGFVKDLANEINHIKDGLQTAIETSIKDERLKAELITNVSHDLRTPLTSIINYVDLLKRENIKDENVQHYIEVLDSKSQRLKQLTEDLVEAAKATTGNIDLEMTNILFSELIKQALGEFEEKFEEKKLTIINHLQAETAMIVADGKRTYRILENLFQNIYKYAMENTRVYIELFADDERLTFILKNISEKPLNVNSQDLTERFIRGDESRSVEGSGLGLSIAKDLTILQEGSFDIFLDGDLFKIMITFPLAVLEQSKEE